MTDYHPEGCEVDPRPPVFDSYIDLPKETQDALVVLELFIGDMDGKEIDDGILVTDIEVIAFNKIVAALRGETIFQFVENGSQLKIKPANASVQPKGNADRSAGPDSGGNASSPRTGNI